MHKQTKACAISPKVKKAVYERDSGKCVICGKAGTPNSHYIKRSQGGLGIEENIITMCAKCHYDYDFTEHRAKIKELVKSYLKSHYPDWSESELIYRKWNLE